MNAIRTILCLVCLISPRLLTAENLIRFEKQQLEARFFGEGAAIADLNRDGHADIIYGPLWWEGPQFQKSHAIYPVRPFPINGYSDCFMIYTPDLDRDGWPDVLVLGFPGKEARWYRNPGNDAAEGTHWQMHVALDVVDNESPLFTDLTGDGTPKIVCSQGGRFGYATPPADPAQKWPFVPVTDNVGVQRFTHGLGVGDIDGDGRLDLLEARRWWRQEPAPAAWSSRPFQLAGSGGAQMHAYDLDGDGDNDVISSINAHQFGLAWFENRRETKDGPRWIRHDMVGREPWENEYGVRFSQPHAVALVDVDGDGLKDIITGKRYWAHNGKDPDETDPRVIYWFQTQRSGAGKVTFIPRLVDSGSGVGTELTTGDVNGDGLVDIVSGNKSGCYVFIQRREEADADRLAQFQPRKIYGPEAVLTEAYAAGQSAVEAVKTMVLPEGFRAEVIAAEPDLVQPIAMCWDERGRIWVVEGNTYPEPAKSGAGKDRILIFEDGDGNGTFETRKVFAEGLNLVSGIEVGFGGVWVGAAPHLLFIPDKDRDDRPDGGPQVLLDGWGSQDTHETLNSFVWGPDGWLYGCHGVFTHSLVGRPGAAKDERQPLNAGVWRYHPVRHEFEVFAHGTSNPWGLDFNDQGEFFVTACVIPHLFHILPGGRYHRQAGQHFNPYTYDDIKTIARHRHYAGEVRDHAHWGDRKSEINATVPASTDQAGGGHAHCGLAIYQGDHFPELYRGALLFGNLHGHRLVHNAVQPFRSGYEGQRRADFMRANDHWFIPVTQKTGPDGALYVTDWYDQQTCHHRDPVVWDRGNGRIYRIVYDRVSTGWQQEPLVGKADDGLVAAALDARNDWQSRMARRLLMERQAAGAKLGEAASAQLMAGLMEQGSTVRQLRALWTLHQTGLASREKLLSLLDHPAPPVRAWAVRFLGDLKLQGNALAPVLARLADFAGAEKSPLVRRELASMLQQLPVERRGELALALVRHAEDETDPNIPLLVWYGIEPLVAEDGAAGIALAGACRWEKISGFVYRRMAVSGSGRDAVLQAVAGQADPVARRRLLELVVAAARESGKLPPPGNWAEVSTKLRLGASPQVLELVQELAACFGDEAAVSHYRKVLVDTTAPTPRREQALRVLLQMGDRQSAPLLHRLILARDTGLTRAALQALASLPHAETPQVLMGVYPALDGAEKADAVATLGSTSEGALALLAGVESGGVNRNALSPFLLRQIQSLKNPQVDEAVQRVWGTVNSAKENFPQQKAKYTALLTPERLKQADSARGKVLYAGTCGACHQLFGEGVSMGPDLTGSNRGNLDYLLENVLDPNAIIGKDYQLNLFTMEDGRVLSGIVKEDAEDRFRLVMPGGVEFTLEKAGVKSREVSKFSTMPEGMFDALSPEQVLDLVAYLQSETAGGRSRAPGLQEAETLGFLPATAGQARAQSMGGFGQQWSGGRQLWWTGGQPGAELELRLPVEKAGKYALKIALTRARDYAMIECRLDGEILTASRLDLYHAKVTPTGELDWGVHDLAAGEHRMVLRITGANPAAVKGYMVGVDYLKLEPR